jgi:hypothetical protein
MEVLGLFVFVSLAGVAILGAVPRWWHYLLTPCVGVVALAPLALSWFLARYLLRDHFPSTWLFLFVLLLGVASIVSTPLVLAWRQWVRRMLGLVD